MKRTCEVSVYQSGEGGIRTRGTCDSTRHFQCRTFGLSVTSPKILNLLLSHDFRQYCFGGSAARMCVAKHLAKNGSLPRLLNLLDVWQIGNGWYYFAYSTARSL